MAFLTNKTSDELRLTQFGLILPPGEPVAVSDATAVELEDHPLIDVERDRDLPGVRAMDGLITPAVEQSAPKPLPDEHDQPVPVVPEAAGAEKNLTDPSADDGQPSQADPDPADPDSPISVNPEPVDGLPPDNTGTNTPGLVTAGEPANLTPFTNHEEFK